jgi:hypothetical protein
MMRCNPSVLVAPKRGEEDASAVDSALVQARACSHL